MPGAEEVPEPDRDEEHHRPAVRERRLRARLLGRAELQERPCLDGQERERDHLGGREERAQRHVLGRLAREVQVVHRADDAAERVQDDVEVDHRQRDPLAHHAEQHEHVGDHHRGEQLEEVLDPQVHDPEAPELGDGEVVAGARDQTDGVERRDRAARRGRTARACCRRCSLRSRPRSTRQSMNTHTNRPTVSRTCQTRARSRYSKPWRPNQFEAAPSSTPWMPRNEPISVPKTTTASAPSSAKASLP